MPHVSGRGSTPWESGLAQVPLVTPRDARAKVKDVVYTSGAGTKEAAIGALFLLAFALSLDNCRSSIGIGALRSDMDWAIRVAITFGLWDGLSPLAGLLIGRFLGARFGSLADEIGPVVLAAYGAYLIAQSVRSREEKEPDDRWLLFGLPLSLSLDNLVAGAGLGLLGFPALVSAATLGLISATMSFAGLQLGRAAARILPLRSDFLGGFALIIAAVVLALGG